MLLARIVAAALYQQPAGSCAGATWPRRSAGTLPGTKQGMLNRWSKDSGSWRSRQVPKLWSLVHQLQKISGFTKPPAGTRTLVYSYIGRYVCICHTFTEGGF